MQFLKSNKKWLIGLVVCAVVFFFIGKNSNPAKVETKEVVKIEYVKETVAEEKSNSMVSGKKVTKVNTKPDGEKSEVTIEEFLSAHSAENKISQLEREKVEAQKQVETLNSLLWIRGGVIGTPSDISKPHALITASYGGFEGVAHSDLKLNHWVGGAWGFGF